MSFSSIAAIFKQRFYFEIAAQSSNSALDSGAASFPTHPHWNVCASPVMMSGIYLRPPFPIIILIILLLLCSILIGWCWHNLPTQTFFLPCPGARPVFLANYRSLSEMICNVAGFQWITLTSPIYMTCQYPSPFSHITRRKKKQRKTVMRGKELSEKWCPFKKSPAGLMSAKQQSSGNSNLGSTSLCFIANTPPWHLCCLNYCYVNHLKSFGIGKAADLGASASAKQTVFRYSRRASI